MRPKAQAASRKDSSTTLGMTEEGKGKRRGLRPNRLIALAGIIAALWRNLTAAIAWLGVLVVLDVTAVGAGYTLHLLTVTGTMHLPIMSQHK